MEQEEIDHLLARRVDVMIVDAAIASGDDAISVSKPHS